uniref:Prolyl endopeptidase n=1 Tax=Strongyloides papillosus TaxID=174720 RepID=A0A0N5CCI1_STREA
MRLQKLFFLIVISVPLTYFYYKCFYYFYNKKFGNYGYSRNRDSGSYEETEKEEKTIESYEDRQYHSIEHEYAESSENEKKYDSRNRDSQEGGSEERRKEYENEMKNNNNDDIYNNYGEVNKKEKNIYVDYSENDNREKMRKINMNTEEESEEKKIIYDENNEKDEDKSDKDESKEKKFYSAEDYKGMINYDEYTEKSSKSNEKGKKINVKSEEEYEKKEVISEEETEEKSVEYKGQIRPMENEGSEENEENKEDEENKESVENNEDEENKEDEESEEKKENEEKDNESGEIEEKVEKEEESEEIEEKVGKDEGEENNEDKENDSKNLSIEEENENIIYILLHLFYLITNLHAQEVQPSPQPLISEYSSPLGKSSPLAFIPGNRRIYPSTIEINVTKYPLFTRDGHCAEQFFGQTVYCPYRQLENAKSEKTIDFIKSFNNLSNNYLKKIKIREKLEKKIREYLKFGKYSLFERHGKYFYYFHRSGLNKHSVMMRRKSTSDYPEVYFDITKHYLKNHTVFNGFVFSADGKKMAYMVKTLGSKFSMIRFLDEKGKHLNDKINDVQFSSMAFAFGGKGFFYSTFDSLKNKQGKITKLERHSLYYHVMGKSANDDVKVVTFPQKKDAIVMGMVSNDERYLYIKVAESNKQKYPMVLYCDLKQYKDGKIKGELKMKPLLSDIPGNINIISFFNDEIIAILSTMKNPANQIIKIKLSKDKKKKNKWSTFLKYKKKRPVQYVTPVGKKYLVVYFLEDVDKYVEIYCMKTGKFVAGIDVDFGKITGISGNYESDYIFIGISNQVSPNAIHFADLSKIKKHTFYVKMNIVVDTCIKGIIREKFVMKKVEYPSFDGKKVPMYLFHRKDVQLNGRNPLLLEGYGGFGFTPFPEYDGPVLAFVNNLRGIYALAGIRGGGEYGKPWHEAGSLLRKNNTFEDFISAAMYLIQNKYTIPAKLAIRGATNGGLLAAVVAQRRPDLFSTVIAQYGVYDMLRFHKIGSGAKWIPEYGDPSRPVFFRNLFSYSPLHNLRMPKSPIQLPSMLLIADEANPQVSYIHTVKYAAELYFRVQRGISHQTNPILVNVKLNRRLTTVSPVEKTLEAVVDIFSFIKETLNITWND